MKKISGYTTTPISAVRSLNLRKTYLQINIIIISFGNHFEGSMKWEQQISHHHQRINPAILQASDTKQNAFDAIRVS